MQFCLISVACLAVWTAARLTGISTQTLLKPVAELDLEELFASIPETEIPGW